jgi:hypothetical protein
MRCEKTPQERDTCIKREIRWTVDWDSGVSILLLLVFHGWTTRLTTRALQTRYFIIQESCTPRQCTSFNFKTSIFPLMLGLFLTNEIRVPSFCNRTSRLFGHDNRFLLFPQGHPSRLHSANVTLCHYAGLGSLPGRVSCGRSLDPDRVGALDRNCHSPM